MRKEAVGIYLEELRKDENVNEDVTVPTENPNRYLRSVSQKRHGKIQPTDVTV